jgi:hypothetical protein
MDANQSAARVVKETADRHSKPLPADLEAAWKAWSAGVGKVDERGMALLRAAFEGGVDAIGYACPLFVTGALLRAAFEAGVDAGKRLPR